MIDVQVVGDARVDHGPDAREIALAILEIAAGSIDAHRRAHDAGFPVCFQPLHD